MPSISLPALAVAGVTAAGSIASSVIGGNAAKSAASTQASAANDAAQVQQNMFNTTTANEAPYLSAGNNALAALMQGLGLTPGQSDPNVANGSLNAPFNPANLASTPGYQWQLGQGLQALEDAQSATGGVGGGNTLKAITQYGQGLASTTYQQQLANYLAQQNQQFGQLQTIAGSGQNAAADLGSLGNQAASNIGEYITQAGNANAAGQVGAANAITGGNGILSSNYLTAALANANQNLNPYQASYFSSLPPAAAADQLPPT